MTRGRIPERTNVAILAATIIGLIVFPMIAALDLVQQVTLNFALSVLALSLAFVWGFAGIFSFGQTAFFGIGGYTYAVIAINLGDSTLAIVGGIIVPIIFAVLIGYFMFYSRLASIYVAVITLVLTLILYKFMGQTANESYAIGSARLGGYNGMPAIPPINVPGDPNLAAGPVQMFYIAGLSLFFVYLGLRWLLTTRFGQVLIGMRENELRIELLGFDVRLLKLLAFALGAAIAGLAGVLFTNWNAFIDPHVLQLGFSAQVIIWVIIGGLGTLIGPIIGAFILSTLSLELGTQTVIDINVILGGLFTIFVLLVPQGIVPSIVYVWSRSTRHNDRLGESPNG